MLEEFYTQAFWIGLLKIIGVNLVLSGDNAVVIALAARSLPAKQQKAAVLWGSGAAVAMRIVLTIFAVALLTLPWLKLVGSLLLFWIGIKLLVPEEDDENISASDNLIATIDCNGQQIDGPVEKIMSLLNLQAKWEAFGWTVQTFDGNDIASVIEGLEKAKALAGKGKPVMNLMKTEMGYGVDFMMGSHKWHGVAPNDDELRKALAQLEETLGDY